MTIKTDRLTIRRFMPQDAAGLFLYLSDPAVVRFEPYPPMSAEACGAAAKDFSQSQAFWAICLPEGMLIGQVYLAEENQQSWELGYVFHAAYHGRGYAAEACRALLAWAFSQKKAHRVFAHCNPDNISSWRLLERLGMRREAHHLRNVCFHKDAMGHPLWQDTYVYALLASEWKCIAKKA